MPVSYSVDQEHRVVITRAEGVLTEPELLRVCGEQMRSSEADPGFDRLIDLRDVKALDVPSESVRRWAQMLQEVTDVSMPHRIAIVASANAIFGMARMFEIGQEKSPFEVVVFRDLKPAQEWLELID